MLGYREFIDRLVARGFHLRFRQGYDILTLDIGDDTVRVEMYHLAVDDRVFVQVICYRDAIAEFTQECEDIMECGESYANVLTVIHEQVGGLSSVLTS